MPGFTLFDVLKEDQKKHFHYPKIWDHPVPRTEWKESEFYRKMRNDVWRSITDAKFPAGNAADESTHTLYVCQITSYAILICPTSTKYQYHRPCGYIPRHMPLDDNGHVLKKDVYILTSLIRPMPQDKIIGEDELLYAGKYPYDSIRELD